MSLVIVADDFGLSKGRDDGILEASSKGRLSYASLMVNGFNVDDALNQATKIGLELALHFNITEGIAISSAFSGLDYLVEYADCNPRINCNSLKSYSKVFPGKESGWEKLESLSFEEVEAIEAEFEAQFFKFKELCGCAPTHFDSHQHIHIHPVISERILVKAKSLGIHSVRCPYEPDVGEDLCFAYKVSSLAKEYRQLVESVGLKTTEAFFGLKCCATKIEEFEIIQNLKSLSSTSCEYMTHPGYSEKYWDSFNASSQRDFELQMLLSDTFEEFLKDVEYRIGFDT